MKFIPKNKKFNKVFKLRLKNQKLVEHKTIKLNYGEFGIKALEPGILADANRGILYIDEVNLLDDHVVDVLKTDTAFVTLVDMGFSYAFQVKQPAQLNDFAAVCRIDNNRCACGRCVILTPAVNDFYYFKMKLRQCMPW